MIQRHQPHPPGTFATCSTCRREPKHIVIHGGCSSEPMLTGAATERHTIECARCRRSTARYPALSSAVAEWGIAYSQPQLPLPVRVTPFRKARAA